MNLHRPPTLASIGLAALLATSDALAGSLMLWDEQHVLSDDASMLALRSVAGRHDFDLLVWTTDRSGDQAELDRAAAVGVVGGRLVVVVDALHGRTAVRGFEALRIPSAGYGSVAHAGEGAFGAGRWCDGVASVADAAGRWAVPRGDSGSDERQDCFLSWLALAALLAIACAMVGGSGTRRSGAARRGASSAPVSLSALDPLEGAVTIASLADAGAGEPAGSMDGGSFDGGGSMSDWGGFDGGGC